MQLRRLALARAASVLATLFLVGCQQDTGIRQAVLEGDFLGQPQPGMRAEVFAPGAVSTGMADRDAAFSPDGSEFYFSRMLPNRRAVIMYCVREGNRWSAPTVAPFSGKYSDIEPFVTPDGERLFFASNRPVEGADRGYDIWYVERKGESWGEAVNVGSPVNSEQGEYYPSVTRDGTLYYTASYGKAEDIYLSRTVDGMYGEPENLGEPVNSPGYEYNSWVDPEGSLIMFTAHGREGDLGGGDLYISFRNEDGSWGEAVNMGEAVNSPKLDYCPSLSPDGRFLFFTSSRTDRAADTALVRTAKDIEAAYDRIQNGSDNIYWIGRGIIDSLASEMARRGR